MSKNKGLIQEDDNIYMCVVYISLEGGGNTDMLLVD